MVPTVKNNGLIQGTQRNTEAIFWRVGGGVANGYRASQKPSPPLLASSLSSSGHMADGRWRPRCSRPNTSRLCPPTATSCGASCRTRLSRCRGRKVGGLLFGEVGGGDLCFCFSTHGKTSYAQFAYPSFGGSKWFKVLRHVP